MIIYSLTPTGKHRQPDSSESGNVNKKCSFCDVNWVKCQMCIVLWSLKQYIVFCGLKSQSTEYFLCHSLNSEIWIFRWCRCQGAVASDRVFSHWQIFCSFYRHSYHRRKLGTYMLLCENSKLYLLSVFDSVWNNSPVYSILKLSLSLFTRRIHSYEVSYLIFLIFILYSISSNGSL